MSSGTPATEAARPHRPWIYVAIAAALLVSLFVPLPGRFRATWIGALQDLAHVPLFAAVTWLLISATGRPLLAAGIAMAIAAVSEPVQALVGRSASLADVARGVCGVAAAIGWRLAAGGATAPRRPAAGAALIAAALAWPLWVVVPTLVDAVRAWRAFPVLAEFSDPWENRRWWLERAQLHIVRDDHGGPVGLLTVNGNPLRSGSMTLFPVLRDWSPWKSLLVEFSVEESPLGVTLSVRDGRRVDAPLERFDRHAVYPPGRYREVIDLGQLARGTPPVAPLDMHAVQSFHIIVDPTPEPREIKVHRVWLE